MEVNAIKTLIEEQGEAFETFRAANDSRLDRLETAMRRPGSGADLPSPDATAHADAVRLYLRKGETAGLSELEHKALSVGSDPDGGYYVTPEMSGRISEIVRQSSPIRQLATVESIGSSSLEIIRDEDEAGSGWVGETEARSETTTPIIGKKEIVAHELFAEPRATQTLLDDSGINIEEWLGRKVSQKFARDEATAFVNGNGVGKPRGYLTYPNGTASGEIDQVISGDANLITMDGLINLQTALKDTYLSNAVWLMKQSTIGEVRKLKDPNGQYLWQQSVQAGVPSLLLGHPVFAADDMPAIAASALPVAFGDLRAAYTIVDRLGVRILRDALTAKPWVKFYSTKRVGGDVVNFEAIKLQVISA